MSIDTSGNTAPTPDARDRRIAAGLGLAGVVVAGLVGYGLGQHSQPAPTGTTVEQILSGCTATAQETQDAKQRELNAALDTANTKLDEAQKSGDGISEAAKGLEAARATHTEGQTALIAEISGLVARCVQTDLGEAVQKAGMSAELQVTNVKAQ